MSPHHEPGYDPRTQASLLEAWAQPVLMEALGVIGDGIRDVSGFRVAAFGVIRNGNEMEYVAISGDDPGLRSLLGQYVPLAPFAEEWQGGTPLGRFILIPHDRRTSSGRWIAQGIEATDDPERWHPRDIMVAPLRDTEGRLIGVLLVDDPVSGLRPQPGDLPLLDTFAEHTEKAMHRALRMAALTEQVDLGSRVGKIVRSGETLHGEFELLAQVGDQLRDALSCSTVSFQIYDDATTVETAPPLRRLTGALVEHETDFRSITFRAAQQAGARDSVGLVAEGRLGSSFMLPEEHRLVLEQLKRGGLASGIMIPLCVGDRVLGSMLLGRTAEAGPWTDQQLTVAAEVGHDLGRAMMAARLHQRDLDLVRRLREVDAYKTQLITQISHEFRSPLTSIVGHLELTEERGGQMPPPSLTAMRRGADRLVRLTEQLLTLSAITEPGEASEQCDAAAVVTAAIATCADGAARRDLELVGTVMDGPVLVPTSEYELELLVHNLVDNAVKYSDSGQIHIVLEPADDGCRLWVRDDGIGISPTDREHLFEEFFRSSRSEAVIRPGTGLGLSIVARVAERLGTAVEVESEIGEGTTVTVTLPTVPSEQ